MRAGEGGRSFARLHAKQGSGSLPSLRGADALVVLDRDRERFAAGETLVALPLRPVAFTGAPMLP